jgi:competence protein ComEA
MEINVKGKTYKIAWEYVIAPFLILLVVVVLVISNYSSIRSVWIDYSDSITPAPSATPLPVTTSSDAPSKNESTPVAEGSQTPASQTPQPLPSVKDAKININKASMEELMTLPFIGEVKAKAIIDYRTTNGEFKSVDDLDNIKGIGPKTLEKLRPFVSV